MTLLNRMYDHICSNVFGIRLKPKVIQMPITNKCNSKCTTCNIWKVTDKCDLSVEQLQVVLQDTYLDKVESIGINGGEPFLHKDFLSIIGNILNLKSLKDIYIISNGVSSNLLLNNLSEAKKLCKKKGVKLNLTISLDGVGGIHDKTRGIPGSFEKTIETINCIKDNINEYCDNFDLGYTISKSNTSDMVWAKELAASWGVDVYFHLAVPNKRIYTFDNEDYSVLQNKKSSFLAREFFYSEFVENSSIKKKFKSFINYYYLKDDKHKRIAVCNYIKRDITINESLDLYLCATASEKIGSLLRSSISDYIKSGDVDRECINIKKNCGSCIHYAFAPTFYGIYLFIKEKYAKANLLIYLIRSRLHLL